MNEFKQQVLSAIDNHTGFTTNDYLDDMQLDQQDKPKLSRVLSELKKDGYVSSVMGEDKLLCWSLTPKGAAYVAENRKGLKFDVIPGPQYNPDDVAFKDCDVKKIDDNGFEIINGWKAEYTAYPIDLTASSRLFKLEGSAIDYLKEVGGGTITKSLYKEVIEVKPITTFQVRNID